MEVDEYGDGLGYLSFDAKLDVEQKRRICGDLGIGDTIMV